MFLTSCVVVTAEPLTASCRHLKFCWEPGRIGLSLRWYYRKVGLLVGLFLNSDKTSTHGVNTPFPDLLYCWITRSISRLGSPLRCSPWGRKGPPGQGVHPRRVLLRSDCSWQQQLAVTFPAQEILCRDWCNSVIPGNQVLFLMLKFKHSFSFEDIYILNIQVFQRCLIFLRKGMPFLFLRQFCLHLWRVKGKCLSSNSFPRYWGERYWVYLCLFLVFSRYAYLQRYIAEPLPCKGEEWQPLIWYRNSLLASEDEESSVLGSSGEWSPVGTSKMSSFKRKLSNGMKTSLFWMGCLCFVPAKMHFMLCISSTTVCWTFQFELWLLPSALLLLKASSSGNSRKVGLETLCEPNSDNLEFCSVLSSGICLCHWDLVHCFQLLS